jgi:hypothetical protein
MMKSLQKHLLTATLLASLGVVAIAQTPTPPPARSPAQMYAQRGMPQDPARMLELRQLRMERALAGLKLKLQISGAQEGAWNAWANAMKPTGPRQRLDRAEFERLTTPERIDRMRARRATGMAEMDRMAEATKSFYAALNADQKKVFDGESLRMLQRGGRGMRGGHRGHHRG